MTPIFLLSGQAKSGKDTVAREWLNIKPKGKAIALADPIKDCIQYLFGVDGNVLRGPSELRNTTLELTDALVTQAGGRMADPLFKTFLADMNMTQFDGQAYNWFSEEVITPRTTTVRRLLQTFGTEWGRANSPNVWIDYGLRRAQKLLASGEADYVLITDGRFRNELMEVKKIGGKVVSVVDTNRPVNILDTHASEMEQTTIPSYWYDYTFHNTKDGIDILREKMRYFTNDVFYAR